MSVAIYLQQALHGYLDGHQLIAASFEIARDQQSQLLVMSDLSGPAFRNGYDNYLTGYPLSGGGAYCIARTWFAPELPRPGCVWTHTLFIRDEDVARIVDFRALKDLFRRPSDDFRIDAYQSAILFDEQSPVQSMTPKEWTEVIAALYGTEQRIVVPSESSQTLEDPALATLTQQWPRLRRSFRFCTGSLSLRETDFDLSISPPEVTHSVGDTGLVVHLGEPSIGATKGWTELAVSDLSLNVRESAYRQFLWTFGPDYMDGRKAFRPLTEVFLLLSAASSSTVCDSTLSAMAYYYPNNRDARRLKSELFGQSGQYVERLGGEATILKMLVTHPAASSVSDEVANVAGRAGQLVNADLDTAVDIAALADQIGGDNARIFLEGFSRHNNWSAESLLKLPFTVLSLVLAHNPLLIASAAVWKRPDYMSILIKFISQIENDSSLLSRTIGTMIDAGAWEAIAWLFERKGDEAAAVVFGRIEDTQSAQFDDLDPAYAILAARAPIWTGLLDKQTLGPKSLKFLSAGVDPRSYYARKVTPSRWLQAANEKVGFINKRRSLRSLVFFLCMGIKSAGDIGAGLVAISFSQVYDATRGNELDELLWQQLEPHLAWYSPSWDHCARLVRTIARGFKEGAWPLKTFLSTFQSAEQLNRALAEIDDMWGGSRYLHRLREAVRSRDISGTEEQMMILSSVR